MADIHLTDVEREALTWCIAAEACIHTGRVDENTITGCRDCEAIGQAAASAVERIVAARLRVQAEQIATAIEHYRDESMLGRCRDCLYEAGRIARDHAPKED